MEPLSLSSAGALGVYQIRNTDGELVRVHVDKSTKLDKVVEGDMVKAYVTDKGHVTTLQRIEK